MSLGTNVTGRLSESLTLLNLTNNLRRADTRLLSLQTQLATGRQFTLPSEAPSDAIRAIETQTRLERQSQLLTNTRIDQEFLSVTENSLGTVADVLARARAIVQAGIGDTSAPAEKEALAVEVESLIRGALDAVNVQHRGEFIFGGSEVSQQPFDWVGDNLIEYYGDGESYRSRVDLNITARRNFDGLSAFLPTTLNGGTALDPATTLTTPLETLFAGDGVEPGRIEITVDDGVNNATQTVDLSGAKTLDDIRVRIEDAFAAGPITVAVDIDPATNSGLRLTPSAGTIAIADVNDDRTATTLGITSTAVAVVTGADLDPELTANTELTSLNDGAGIGALAGLQISIGEETHTVSLAGAATVEDVLNAIRAVDSQISAEIGSDGDRIDVRYHGSGFDFSIGENGGTNATGLGIRTFTPDATLASLNLGDGVDLSDPLEVTLSDGSTLSIDLSTATTIQDVLTLVNAAQPGDLVASLNTTGNGITLTDTLAGGTPLSVAENPVSIGLGITSASVGNVITGSDVHPQSTAGVFDLLLELRNALEAEDNAKLTALGGQLETEFDRVEVVRGEVGVELQFLDRVEQRLLDQEVEFQAILSETLDADLTEVITNLASAQAGLQATLQVTSQSFQLSLLNFL